MRKTAAGLLVLALALGATSPTAVGAEDTASLIAQNMKQSGKLKDYRVGVKYEDGTALLMGTVTSPQQKKIAEQLARGTTGVKKVISRIEVEGAEQLQMAEQAPPQDLQPVAAFQPQPMRQSGMPVPYAAAGQAPIQPAAYAGAQMMAPMPMAQVPPAIGQAVSYDSPQVPGYAWPSYAASPNYAALTYPKQYSPSAWPYIGPFYPYPQVPLGWRKVTLEWDDGWWFLDFKDCKRCQ